MHVFGGNQSNQTKAGYSKYKNRNWTQVYLLMCNVFLVLGKAPAVLPVKVRERNIELKSHAEAAWFLVHCLACAGAISDSEKVSDVSFTAKALVKMTDAQPSLRLTFQQPIIQQEICDCFRGKKNKEAKHMSKMKSSRVATKKRHMTFQSAQSFILPDVSANYQTNHPFLAFLFFPFAALRANKETMLSGWPIVNIGYIFQG